MGRYVNFYLGKAGLFFHGVIPYSLHVVNLLHECSVPDC